VNAATCDDRMTTLHTQYRSKLTNFLLRFTGGDRQAAEDLAQETLIRTWRNLNALPDGTEETRRWLFTVARHVAIDAIRRRRARPDEVSLSDYTVVPYAADPGEVVLAGQSLRRAFDDLSADHRAVLSELYLQGRSTAEAASRLGVPVGTIKSRAHYALRGLRAAIN
jgi:RNA polymerase sigma-70 factor (ECF subfamily)